MKKKIIKIIDPNCNHVYSPYITGDNGTLFKCDKCGDTYMEESKKKIDWLEIMVECGCGRQHRWKVHGIKEVSWVEKLV